MVKEFQEKKAKTKDIIVTLLCIAVIIIIFAKLFFLPGTGRWAMINESIYPLLFLVSGIYIIVVMVQNIRAGLIKKTGFFLGIVIACGLLGGSVWMSGKIVSDIIHGPITTKVYSVKVEKNGTRFFHYYLYGNGENQKIRATISRHEYYDLEKADTMEITYYPKTQRILDYKVLKIRPNKWSDFDFEQREKNKDHEWDFTLDDETKELMEKYSLENQN